MLPTEPPDVVCDDKFGKKKFKTEATAIPSKRDSTTTTSVEHRGWRWEISGPVDMLILKSQKEILLREAFIHSHRDASQNKYSWEVSKSSGTLNRCSSLKQIFADAKCLCRCSSVTQ